MGEGEPRVDCGGFIVTSHEPLLHRVAHTIGDSPMASKRELIEPTQGDKRFVRRDESGKFKESDDVGKSLAQDRTREAKNDAPRGHGDRGDREN